VSVADGDCDDSEPWVNPTALEICNDVDDNCDGQVDEGCNKEVATDDGTNKEPAACGCGTAAAFPSALLVGAALAAARRRRR
jgi:hypothetical protein